MHILVPCKGVSSGKTRLRDGLGAREHRVFCENLIVKTLTTAASLAGEDRVWFVTSDDEARSIANRYSVCHVADTGFGLNSALEAARARLLTDTEEAAEALVLPVDLPFAEPDALHDMCRGEGDLVIAPDEQRKGTNVLLMRSTALRNLRFAYGAGSFAAHMTGARELGLSVSVVEDWRLSFDIDETDDYFRLMRGDAPAVSG